MADGKKKWEDVYQNEEEEVQIDIAKANEEKASKEDKPAITHPDYDELEAQLTEAEKKRDQNWQMVLRLQADIENVRKRGEQNVEQAHKYALEKFAKELLLVMDSLERGLEQMGGEGMESYRTGVELTLKQLQAVFAKFGIKEVNPLHKPFDPTHHEAMTMQESDKEPGTVLEVLQKGYLLNDRLLRPALVMVAKKS